MTFNDYNYCKCLYIYIYIYIYIQYWAVIVEIDRNDYI